MKKLYSIWLCCLAVVFLLWPSAHELFAQQLIKDVLSPQTKGQTEFQYETVYNPLQTVSIPEVIGRVINFVMGLLGTLALVLIIYGGFLWMTSRGNDAKVKLAKNILIWTSAGILVIFMAYIAVRFVFQLIGK